MRMPREDQMGFLEPKVIRVAGIGCIDLTHCYCLIWQQHVSLRSSWNHLMVCYLHLIFLFYPRWKTLKFGTCGIEATFIVSCSFLWKLIFIPNLSESRIPWGIISGYVCETVYKLVRMHPPCIVRELSIMCSGFPILNEKENMSCVLPEETMGQAISWFSVISQPQ